MSVEYLLDFDRFQCGRTSPARETKTLPGAVRSLVCLSKLKGKAMFLLAQWCVFGERELPVGVKSDSEIVCRAKYAAFIFHLIFTWF